MKRTLKREDLVAFTSLFTLKNPNEGNAVRHISCFIVICVENILHGISLKLVQEDEEINCVLLHHGIIRDYPMVSC